MRRDTEVPLELGMTLTCRNVSHPNLELDCRWRLSTYFPFHFGSSSVIRYSFLALPLQYHHQCQYTAFTLRSCGNAGPSLCSIVSRSFPHLLPPSNASQSILLKNLPMNLRVSVAERIVMYVIPLACEITERLDEQVDEQV